MKRFTDLEVWRRSHTLFLDVLKELDGLPRTRAAAALTDQVVRSIGSIGANIAEGFNRSKSRYLNALDIALGEANESENWLYKVRDAGFISPETAKPYIAECIEIEKMLSGLIRSIRSKP
ncbi:MAG: four helix bundle protein [Thermoguttaceae bacterium]|nr:four helix bundle protein [Thermoguttaceae bacterium]